MMHRGQTANFLGNLTVFGCVFQGGPRSRFTLVNVPPTFCPANPQRPEMKGMPGVSLGNARKDLAANDGWRLSTERKGSGETVEDKTQPGGVGRVEAEARWAGLAEWSVGGGSGHGAGH